MNLCISKLAKKLEAYQIISPEEYDIYYYGLEILLYTTITSLSILLISHVINSVVFGIIYLFITMPLRSTLGGYHASTHMLCFLLSNLLYCSISILINLFNDLYFSYPFACILLLINCIYLYCSKPTRNLHHPVSNTVLIQNKVVANYFLSFDIILIVIFYLIDINTEIIFLSIFSVTSVSFLKIIVYRKES